MRIKIERLRDRPLFYKRAPLSLPKALKRLKQSEGLFSETPTKVWIQRIIPGTEGKNYRVITKADLSNTYFTEKEWNATDWELLAEFPKLPEPPKPEPPKPSPPPEMLWLSRNQVMHAVIQQLLSGSDYHGEFAAKRTASGILKLLGFRDYSV